MRSLKFISSRGEVAFLLDKPTPYVFRDLRGTGKPGILVLTSQSSNQDGETLHDAYYEPREMDFSGYVYGEDQYAMYQRLQQLNAVIGSKKPLRIEYTNDYGSYYISGVVTDPLGEDARIRINGHYKPVSITIRCPDPVWRASVGGEEATIAYRAGRFCFPFQVYRPAGVTFGRGGYRAEVINTGDTVTPVEIFVKAPSIQPTITNLSTGRFMSFDRSLQAHETLYVNTDPLKKTVEVRNAITGNSKKALDILKDIDAEGWDFWQLQPGANVIAYDSGADDIATATVILQWASRFAGV